MFGKRIASLVFITTALVAVDQVQSQHIHQNHPAKVHAHGGGRAVWKPVRYYDVGGQQPMVVAGGVNSKVAIIDRFYTNGSCTSKPFKETNVTHEGTKSWSVGVEAAVGSEASVEAGGEMSGEILALAAKLHAKTTAKASVNLKFNKELKGSKKVTREFGSPAYTLAPCTTSNYKVFAIVRSATGSAQVPAHDGYCLRQGPFANNDRDSNLFQWRCNTLVTLRSSANSDIVMAQEDVGCPDVVSEACEAGCGSSPQQPLNESEKKVFPSPAPAIPSPTPAKL